MAVTKIYPSKITLKKSIDYICNGDKTGDEIYVTTHLCSRENAYDGIRYIRIGSSKVNVAKYPDREASLFEILRSKEKTIENIEFEYQDLTFERLFTYYAGKGISLKARTFKKNLGLLTKDGKYNLMTQLLSDNSHISVRVSIFSGETEVSPLYSVKEFRNTCIL